MVVCVNCGKGFCQDTSPVDNWCVKCLAASGAGALLLYGDIDSELLNDEE